MDSMKAFAMGQANKGKEEMVFDWDKAARIIKERKVKNASAGLSNDWKWTSGEIFTDGKPNTESYTYLASTWATPELEIDGEIISCFKMESETSGWNGSTKWPDSSLKILKGDTNGSDLQEDTTPPGPERPAG